MHVHGRLLHEHPYERPRRRSYRANLAEQPQAGDAQGENAFGGDEAETKASGAIRIPPDEAEKHIADVSRDDTVVTYCT